MKSPERSEGARYERKAIRNYLRRQIANERTENQKVLEVVLDWVLTRQKRYDKKTGGLGKK